MVTPISLYKLPPEPSGGCCDPPAEALVAPLIPYNAPGLSAITYRIGTFGSFRHAMLDKVTDPHLLDLLDMASITTNPFARWHEGTHGDYQTLFVELWAYLADILTFYQERIANEAYLPTATQRDSLLRLAQLTNYRSSPGAGASALLAFTAEAGKLLNIPASFRVGSKALPGKPSIVFETNEAINARGEYSAIPLAKFWQVDQFDTLTSNTRSVVLQGANNRLNAGDHVLIVENEGLGAEEAATLRQIAAVSADKTANTTILNWNEPVGTATRMSLCTRYASVPDHSAIMRRTGKACHLHSIR